MTDAQGRWRSSLPRLPRSWADVEVTADGYLPTHQDLAVNHNDRRPQRTPPPILLRPATVSLRGRVLDHRSRPVVNALVSGDGMVPAQFRTGRDGSFGPMPAGPGDFGIEVYAPEGLYWWEVFRVPHDARGPFEVTVRIPPPQFATGIVVDDRGRPIAGAEIARDSLWDAGIISGTDGQFRWPLTGDNPFLLARKDGYLQSTNHAFHPGGHGEIVLERAASIEGRIVRADGSHPPPGLTIYSSRVGCEVAADGRFRLSPLRAGPQRFIVEFLTPTRPDTEDKSRFLMIAHADLEIGEHRRDFLIRLPPLAALAGTVVDQQTGRPIANALVESALTDSAGRFVIHVPEEHRESEGIVLDVTADGYASERTCYRVDRPIALRPVREIEVLVEDREGRPLPGSMIRVPAGEISRHDISGVTDFTGRCRVRVPRGEDVVVHADPPERGSTRGTCRADQDLLRLVAGPRPVAFIIFALDEVGRIVPDAWIENCFGRFVAEDDGGIRLTIMQSFDAPLLSAPGRERVMLELRHRSGVETIRQKLRETEPVRLRFVRKDGRAVPGANVTTNAESFWSDAEGRVEIPGFARGERNTIDLRLDGFRTITHEVVADGVERTILVPGRGEIIISYRQELSGGGRPDLDVVESGLRMRKIPCYRKFLPGKIHLDIDEGPAWVFLKVAPGHARFYPDLQVHAGETIQLTYDFPRPGRITGQVLGPDGGEVEDAEVSLFELDTLQADTDHEGRFVFSPEADDVPESLGPVRLLIRHKKYAPVLTETIDLTRDRDLTIRMTRGGTLTGRVQGTPEPVKITILTPGAAEPIHLDSDEREFSFEQPLPAGPHRIRVRTEQGVEIEHEVEIHKGELNVVELHLR